MAPRASLSGGVAGQLRNPRARKMAVEVGDEIGFEPGVAGVIPEIAPLEGVLAQIVELAFGTVVADVGERSLDGSAWYARERSKPMPRVEGSYTVQTKPSR